MKRKAINLCVQHAYQSEKSCPEAQESHVNSLKTRVESNFRSLHSYLDQNETVKKQNIAHFLFIQDPLDIIIIISTLLLIIKQIHVNVCDST